MMTYGEAPLTPHESIVRIARDRLQAFAGTIGPDGEYISRVYQGLQSVSEEIGQDYGERFLLELIQNGYDAHPPDTEDGEIAVRVCINEGKHGTLYVANKGQGFSQGNVQALCEFAVSNKPVGEKIGNKGLGFRSVLSVCRRPEVYSRLDNRDCSRFDGFCFRFATNEDLENLVTDSRHRELAQRDLPAFHIPVPLDHPVSGGILDALAHAGFSTVVRLPLHSEAAYGSVLAAVEELRQQDAPLLVFLPRLSKLTVSIDAEQSSSLSLVRSKTELPSLGGFPTDRFEVVDVGASGRYFVCWRSIPEERVKVAIKASIDDGKLHGAWGDWKGDGELAIAIPIHPHRAKSQLYTYLPMGPDAEAPLHGLLHGAFYPKTNRTSMDVSVPLNELYLREAVKLAASAIVELRSKAARCPALTDSVGHVIIDLMSWRSTSGVSGKRDWAFADLLVDALKEHGMPIQSSDLLPIATTQGTRAWASPLVASRWDTYAHRSIVNPSNLIRIAKIAALPSDIGKERLDRLEQFLIDAGIRESLLPPQEEQARAVEAIAEHLLSRRAIKRAITSWNAFYQDIGDLLGHLDPEHWANRRILLCNDGELRCPSQEGRLQRRRKRGQRLRRQTPVAAAIFLPPAAPTRERVLDIPKSLRPYFAFLHPDLDWAITLEHTRQSLEHMRAVSLYRAGEIVASISRVVAQQSRVPIRQAGLVWAFQLWEQTKGDDVLGRADLLVPTTGGAWIRAKEAMFSRGWPEMTLGRVTHDLIDRAGSTAPELSGLSSRLLASPDSAPFDRRSLDLWKQFLEVLGVSRGLRLARRQPVVATTWGHNISLSFVCKELGIGPRSQKYIVECSPQPRPIEYQGTTYRLPIGVACIPGQEDFESLDDHCKALYAQLVLEMLPLVGESDLVMGTHSESFRYAGSAQWPSPAQAFLRMAGWFPVATPGNQQGVTFLRPDHVLLEPESGERLPVFLARPLRSIRKSLTTESVRQALQRICGCGVFDEQESSVAQVQLLAQAFDSGWCPQSQERAFENVYWDTWSRVIKNVAAREWEWLGACPSNSFGHVWKV